jgi:hypothetical protein
VVAMYILWSAWGGNEVYKAVSTAGKG